MFEFIAVFENDKGELTRFQESFTSPRNATYVYDEVDFQFTSTETTLKMTTLTSQPLRYDINVKVIYLNFCFFFQLTDF